MLRLYRIDYPNHQYEYFTAHRWVRAQPDLYREIVGFDDLTDFARHPVEQIDFALREDDWMIAFASLVMRGRKVCEFELITPPRPRIRSILALLAELQRAYFEDLGFVALYTEYPDDPRFDRPRRLCRMFGWRERKSGYFEHTILDHLRATNGQSKKAHSQSAGAV